MLKVRKPPPTKYMKPNSKIKSRNLLIKISSKTKMLYYIACYIEVSSILNAKHNDW